jgi:hypothetical protein
MVNWSLLEGATSTSSKPTPGWHFHEICQDVRNSPKDVPEVAEYLMQTVTAQRGNAPFKAVLCLKHLATSDLYFQQYMLSCPEALKILDDMVAPPAVAQAQYVEKPERRTLREATSAALEAIRMPQTAERSAEACYVKEKCQGFGNFEPPPEQEAKSKGLVRSVVGSVLGSVTNEVTEVVDDLREKGAVVTLKDMTLDSAGLVLDGVGSVWSWVAGKKDNGQGRICKPAPNTSSVHISPYQAAPNMSPQTSAFYAPNVAPQTSALQGYAAAFSGCAIGTQNTFHVPSQMQHQPPIVQQAPAAPAPEVVDLISLDEPSVPAHPQFDLLGEPIAA